MKRKILVRWSLICAAVVFITGSVLSQDHYDIRPVNGKYSFSYNQVPENLVSIFTITGAGFQWEKSTLPTSGFSVITGATSATYSFASALTQTTYFRRKSTVGANNYYSNIIKIEVVSVNWENLNYIRQHDVLIPAQSDWKAIDILPIGEKLQTTTYVDGLGRPVQKIAREMATPPNSNNLWGDVVVFSIYDALGRPPHQYLPYTTTTETGKYKTVPENEQPAYYASVYTETSAFNTPTYDNSPLNRITNVKSPGMSWAAGAGNSIAYELNDANENVRRFTIGYSKGDNPISSGAYGTNMLYKTRYTDENGKQVIEYVNEFGQMILKKVQINDNPSVAHDGWICTYSVYDDFGLLRYRIQPEGVKWLDNHSWTFASTDGSTVLIEWCFRYEYDAKGRMILKKAPGAKELEMIYDKRDRVVFMQDGNQRGFTTPQWTTNIYDELDRPVITTLYNTTKTVTNLQTDIDNAGGVSSVTITAQNVTTATYNNPVTGTNLNNSSVTTIVKYNFYDNYTYTGVKTFNTNFDNAQAYPTGGDPIASTLRTINMHTGSITRILGTTTFLTSTIYYDDKGRPIQTTEDNIKSGTDVTTEQYKFDGRLLSSNTKHTAANTSYTNYSIITKNIFDIIGRVVSIEKKYGSNAFKAIGTYDFDDMGRLKVKHLDPGYTGIPGKTGMESLTYSYNIHNEITGINKDYALKTTGVYNKWNNFFGLYLGYDNKDNVFANPQLDGHVTGTIWNTQGDDAQRKYDFTYDNAGRLTSALFKERQKITDSWDNTIMDFSVKGNNNNKIDYDLNGNLLSMIQKGVVPGTPAPLKVDELTYSYGTTANNHLGNKLGRVNDSGDLGTNNGKLGDFADGANNNDDYVYDDNGNLVIDLNKNAKELGGVTGANGIRYNFLDKPEEIEIPGKGAIKIVYDADGNKLQRSFTTTSGGLNPITTTYINQFIYEGDNLRYINFEEGRIRVMNPNSSHTGPDMLEVFGNMDLLDNKQGAYDFFIRDYQGNVRMILTEGTHFGSNSCTMETARAGNEEPIFGQVDANGNPSAGNEVAARYLVDAQLHNDWTDPSVQNYVSRLGSQASSKMGPNVLLRVMAGDQVSATTIYFYRNADNTYTGSNTLLSSLLNSLLSAIAGGGATHGVVKGAAGNITTQLGGSVPLSNFTSPDANANTSHHPQAYLTMLFFDERFRFVEESSSVLQVGGPGDGQPPLVMDNIKAPKNGYCYIYVSNESNQMVYFDNLQVSQERGRILEENHYYAYGLKIAGISSDKLADVNEGRADNKYLYNDKELFDDADLNWYDYGFRNYDPQIGRFTQLDPLTDDYPELTPYQYASCEPIGNIDIDGLEGETALTAATAKTLQEVVIRGALKSVVKSVSKPVLGTALRTGASAATLTGREVLSNIVEGGKATITATTATISVSVDNLSCGVLNTTGFIAKSGAVPTSQVKNWNRAVTSANETFVFFGQGESIIGGGIAAGSATITSGTGGLSFEVTGPTMIIGGVMVVHGQLVSASALRNLASGNGLIKEEDGTSAETTSEGNYRRLSSNEEANKYAQSKGYKDAHELKREAVGKGNESKFDIEVDRKTGKGRLISKDNKTIVDL